MRHAVILLLCSAILFPIATSRAQDTDKTDMQRGNITVQLTGFENVKGTVKLCLCRSEDEHKGKIPEFCRVSADIKSKKAEWVFKNMPYGRYSIKAFHDENGNSKLDTNFAGMPVELYGFSNNAQGRFGPPSFERAAFTLNEPQVTVAIELK